MESKENNNLHKHTLIKNSTFKYYKNPNINNP